MRRVERGTDGPKSVVGSIHGVEEGDSSVIGGERPWRSGRGWETGRGPARVGSVGGTGEGIGRVVSRSGVELEGEGGNGQREVSGKVVEEGRGGWRSGAYLRRFSGNNK